MIYKKSPLRVGIDLDDTLFSFRWGYYLRFGNIPSKDWCITRNVNHILIKEKSFWLGLQVINNLNFIPELYCSVRINPKSWTKEAIKRNNLPDAKLYQLKGGYGTSKYDTLKNKVDLYIDDSIWNFEDLNNKGVTCFLITTPENKDYVTPLRINSLDINEIMELYEMVC